MRMLILVALICGSSITPGETPRSGRWLAYEPAVVRLAGMLRVVPEYGPPNFGENPETDEKVQVPMLTLGEPINVMASPSRNLDYEALQNVSQIQLVFSSHHLASADLVGHKVVVTGRLFHAQTAHHYTPLLMDVEAIRGATALSE
ncbi:MAG: DUF4431 domain-containing protein [Deltaproteobacteria bacterium]|nr:DUF4431 domain-containing protein [Deltaproteobacteria bacterium]